MQPSINLDMPDVPVPAPVYFGLLLAVGYCLQLLLPIENAATAAQFLAGWAMIAVAAALLLWCFALFVRKRTTIMPKNPVAVLVEQGPYRYSRNPMYVSLALFHLGIALSTANPWHFITFIPDMLAIRYWVIAPEEAYMQARFGPEYSEYCAAVRRWI
ncbi:MAG: methyltransferase family protein [Nevskiales bacterium]